MARVAALAPAPDRPPPPPGPYLVAGLGLAGRAAAAALAELAGAGEVAAWDSVHSPEHDQVVEDLRSQGVTAELGGDGVAQLEARPLGCLVKSPGIPFWVPLLQRAAELGVPVIDEAELGWRLDRRPWIGVTGTNGKSTVTALVRALLAEHGLQAVAAGNTEGGPALSTLPGGEGTVVAELSSFQLAGCPELLPEAAVFTNLSPDHDGWHGDTGDYADAKRRLFVRGDRCVPVAAVNVDDPVGERLHREVTERGGRAVGFGSGPGAEVRIRGAEWTLEGTELELDLKGGSMVLHTRLIGLHNAMNTAAAIALGTALDLRSLATLRAVAEEPRVPGRLESVTVEGRPDVVVDYAHNPAGVAAALDAARGVASQRGARVLAVLSAMALTSRRRCEQMAREAADRSDLLWLTLDRRSEREDPVQPPEGLTEGAGDSAEVVPNRARAIEAAVAAAQPGDVVALLGRGASTAPTLDPDGGVTAFDDRVAAARALAGEPAG